MVTIMMLELQIIIRIIYVSVCLILGALILKKKFVFYGFI